MAFGTVLPLASLVALGYIIGGLLGEFVDVSKQLLNIELLPGRSIRSPPT